MEERIDIKALRKALGLSMEGLARELGVSSVTIWRWEKEDTKPFPLAMEKLKELRRQLPKVTGEFVAPAPSKNPGLVNWFIDQFTQLAEENPDHHYGTMKIKKKLPDGKVRVSFELSEEPDK